MKLLKVILQLYLAPTVMINGSLMQKESRIIKAKNINACLLKK